MESDPFRGKKRYIDGGYNYFVDTGSNIATSRNPTFFGSEENAIREMNVKK